jgi:hypothetical protein
MPAGGHEMNRKYRRIIFLISLSILIAAALPSAVSANSAEPPSLTILVVDPPDDFAITLISGGYTENVSRKHIAWETYYNFYLTDMRTDAVYTFEVTADGEVFECSAEGPFEHYNNVFMLDLSGHELTPGKYPYRSLILVTLRLFFTLIIEGVIFYLFGYRQRRSWLVFLIINILTQGILYLWLDNYSTSLSIYLLFTLFIGEAFVFITEMIAFPVFLREHKKGRALLYAFTTNAASMLAGFLLIALLPV